jgi:hypothetical protein
MRYYAMTEVADDSFTTTTTRLEEIRAELGSAGADEVSLEIVSGVLVGIGFSIEAETVNRARTRVEEILWAISLQRVGSVEIAAPAAV